MPDVRVLVCGERDWCPELLARRLVKRLRKRYGADLVLTHTAAGLTETAFDGAAIRAKVRRDVRPLPEGPPLAVAKALDDLIQGAALVIVAHRALGYSKSSRPLLLRAFLADVPVCLVDAEDAEPVRLRAIPGRGEAVRR